MFQKTDEVKVLRDPVHSHVRVEYEVIWQLINSAWIQRLRRIRQLGGAFMVYHTAEHSRFSHSLGVYEIVRRMVTEVPDLSDALSDREKITVMAAALLHDVGHGPYSHAFEEVLNESHEVYTCRIIEEDPEIRSILESAAPGLSRDVADVIRHQYHNPLLSQLVSSQLDADRMDYLLRDAFFTGTTYGHFDLERILRTLRVVEGRVVVKESGIYAIENYVMARYHSYWQIYYHPGARSYENVLSKLFRRLRDLSKEGRMPKSIPAMKPLIEGKRLSLEEYYVLDEYACNYAFEVIAKGDDPIAADLADRLLNRRLFSFMEASLENREMVRAALLARGFDPEYYLGEDDVGQRVYVQQSVSGAMGIWVRLHGGEIKELSQASNIVQSVIGGSPLRDERIFFPKEIRDLLPGS
ncbi:MAG: HD domain-containing protein [Solobacterium sp.]|nr:HD domain-containing protein [Solobacterium sp.]